MEVIGPSRGISKVKIKVWRKWLVSVVVYPRPSLRFNGTDWPQSWDIQGLASGFMERIGPSRGMSKYELKVFMQVIGPSRGISKV